MQINRHVSFRPADLFGEFDRLIRSSLGRPDPLPREFSVYDSGDGWVLRADLPGYRKADLTLSVHEGQLALEAAASEERATPAFKRSFRLPETVRPDGIAARLENGMLELVLPREAPERSEPRTIDIH